MGEIVKKDDQSAMGDRVLALIRTKFPEYHPLMAIAELAHSQLVKEDYRVQLECHKTLVKYVTPELKSIEVKAELQTTRRVIVSMFDGDVIDMGKAEIVPVLDKPAVEAAQPDPMWNSLEFLEELEAA